MNIEFHGRQAILEEMREKLDHDPAAPGFDSNFAQLKRRCQRRRLESESIVGYSVAAENQQVAPFDNGMRRGTEDQL